MIYVTSALLQRKLFLQKLYETYDESVQLEFAVTLWENQTEQAGKATERLIGHFKLALLTHIKHGSTPTTFGKKYNQFQNSWNTE